MAPKGVDYDYDFFVIGGGSGGVRAARVAAGYGAKVALAEQAALGGTCVNVGCVPKKLFVHASEFASAFREARGFGWTVPQPRHDLAALSDAVFAEVTRLSGIYGRLLSDSGVTVLRGRASLLDAHHVQVGERVASAKYILLATGGHSFVPDISGKELALVSDAMFDLKELPKKLLVVGGGYIAVEFACVFHALGTEVVLAYRGDRVLRGFDSDVRTFVYDALTASGIDIRNDVEPAAVEACEAGRRVTMQDGTVIEADVVLMATGRVPNVKGLGLEQAGVEVDERGAVVVDEACRTRVQNIFAVGDVIDRVTLTPMAIAEGHAVADSLFGGKPRMPDYLAVPTAVFSQPQVATVGMTEEEADTRCERIRVYRTTFRPLKHALTQEPQRMLMKLIVDDESDRVVGCHIVGDDAAEIIQGFAVAMKCGATKAQLDATLGIHPTAGEEMLTMRKPV